MGSVGSSAGGGGGRGGANPVEDIPAEVDPEFLVRPEFECVVCLESLDQPASLPNPNAEPNPTLDELKKLVAAPCGHVFHTVCLNGHFNSKQKQHRRENRTPFRRTCPTCNKIFPPKCKMVNLSVSREDVTPGPAAPVDDDIDVIDVAENVQNCNNPHCIGMRSCCDAQLQEIRHFKEDKDILVATINSLTDEMERMKMKWEGGNNSSADAAVAGPSRKRKK